jgi:hypothetical protein
MTDELFYKIEQDVIFLDKVREFASTAEWKWVPFMHISPNFQKTLGLELTKQDSLLSKLQNKFNSTLRLYMFPSMTVYNWHRDAEMGCSLNLVMEDYDSHTLFNPSDNKEIIDNVIELKYEKNKWHLFNSQILHTVLNLGSNNRILLTVTFPKQVKYQEVLEYLKIEGLVP